MDFIDFYLHGNPFTSVLCCAAIIVCQLIILPHSLLFSPNWHVTMFENEAKISLCLKTCLCFFP